MPATREERRAHYRKLIPLLFDTIAELYYTRWGEFFHLAVFEDGEDETDFDSALERPMSATAMLLAGPRPVGSSTRRRVGEPSPRGWPGAPQGKCWGSIFRMRNSHTPGGG